MNWLKRWFGKAENGIAEEIGEVEEKLHRPIWPIHYYRGVVDGNLTRGAWPSAEQLKALQRSGVRAVINLCSERNQDSDVTKIGMHPFNLPMRDNTCPSDAKVEELLRIVRKYGPAFVHCEQGVGRTGCMVAAYRVKVLGWSPTQALTEAMSYGLSLPYQKDFILRLK